MAIFGSVSHQLDAKNRMRIPSPFKDRFGKEIFLCKAVNGCIRVYKSEKGAEFLGSFSSISSFDSEGQMDYTVFSSMCEKVTGDEQGRYLLSESMRSYAGISKNLVTVGKDGFIEIWAEEHFNEMMKNISYEDIFKRRFEAEKANARTEL